jgi:hypothetical protein
LKNRILKTDILLWLASLQSITCAEPPRNTIQIGGSVEDFLAKANASYDKFLEEEKQRNPTFDDTEARVQSLLMRQMTRNIWFEELLRE